MADQPNKKFAEIGSAGLRQAGGYVSADFLPELNGWRAAKVYGEMGSNDPVISSLLFVVTMMMRRVEWSVEPADKSQQAVAGKEFVENELFKKVRYGWANVMAEVCSFVQYGYAPLEVVYALREDRSVGIDKISLRFQESIESWELDKQTDEILGIWQQPWNRPRVFIPIEKILLFRTTTLANNPEGRSALRGCYVSWRRKRSIEEAEGRAALRAAGVVELRVPGEVLVPGASSDVKAIRSAYESMAQALAEDRQGAVLLPSDVHPETKEPLYQLNYVVADGRRPGDMSPIVERIDKRMAMTLLADFILLGQQAVGSFALTDSKTNLFAQAVGAWLQVVAEVFNSQLMPRWWKLNAFPEETMPKLVPGDLDERDLNELSNFITQLSSAGMPLFPDPELQAYLRKTGRLPEVDEQQLIEQQDQQKLDNMEQQLKIQAANAPEGKPPGGKPKGFTKSHIERLRKAVARAAA